MELDVSLWHGFVYLFFCKANAVTFLAFISSNCSLTRIGLTSDQSGTRIRSSAFTLLWWIYVCVLQLPRLLRVKLSTFCKHTYLSKTFHFRGGRHIITSFPFDTLFKVPTWRIRRPQTSSRRWLPRKINLSFNTPKHGDQKILDIWAADGD